MSDILQNGPLFLTADDVATLIGCSRSYAYTLIRQLQKEMREEIGEKYLIMPGKISRKYFIEKCY